MSGRQQAMFAEPDVFAGGEGISLDDQIREAEREIRMRWDVYPGRVAKGFLREQTARRQTDAMLAIRRSLLRLQALDEGRG